MPKAFLNIALIISSILGIAQIKQAKTYFDLEKKQIKEIFHYNKKDSSLQGSYESFYLNGSLNIIGYYSKNQPDSVWRYYFENGRKKAEGRFKNGDQSGPWTFYYENGNLKSKGILNQEVKDGFWTFYYETGGEKSNGLFRNNEKNGIWNYFYEDGTLKAQAYLENGSGKYTEFYPSGSRRMEGINSNNKSDGKWEYYYESGELEASGAFSDGLKDGIWTYYYKNGNRAAEGKYVNGVRQGKWIYFHENGEISEEGEISNNLKEGYWKLFYPTGELLGEASFESGSGAYDEYYTSGNKKSNGKIIDGKKNGKWYYYSDNGRIEGEADLIDDEGTYIGYYPDGQIKMTGRIKNDKRVGEWILYNQDGSLAGSYYPIYENDKPVFRTRESQDEITKTRYSKPDYKFRRKQVRYFQPRINEYKALIFGTNPIWLIDDQIPLAFEYYIQERLGYELQINILRDPFFKSDKKIAPNTVFNRGVDLDLRQKLYSKDNTLGMFYFGHEISFKHLNHKVNHFDEVGTFNFTGNMTENGYSYSLFIGNRWMRDAGDAGPTIDVFIGIGIGGRSFKKNYENNPTLDGYFDQLINSNLHFPLLFGLNFGWASPKNKSQTQ